MKKGLEKEASVAGNVKGVQLPLGAKTDPAKGSHRKVKKNNVYSDAENFAEQIAQKELGEKIQKRGDTWVIIDPKTGAEVGSTTSRDAARERQRQLGVAQQRDRKKKKNPGASDSEAERQRRSLHPHQNENLKNFIKKSLAEAGIKLVPINEGSMVSYVFEQTPIEEAELQWEGFIEKLSRDTVWADQKLKELISGIVKAEARALQNSVRAVKNVLEATGAFKVNAGKFQREANGMSLGFEVHMAESNSKADFSVRLDNKRPLLIFPENTRQMLNNMATSESRLLKVELMHAQETALDKVEDVIRASKRRDLYLNSVRKKLSKLLDGLNPLELAIAKNLFREKIKGVK